MTAATTGRKITKLTIPQPAEPGVNLVGTLEQLDPDASTHGRRIALVSLSGVRLCAALIACCVDTAWYHGVSSASCPSSCGYAQPGSLRHKDYLFQKRLAQSLPMDSLRFDFRYGHIIPALILSSHYIYALVALSNLVASGNTQPSTKTSMIYEL